MKKVNFTSKIVSAVMNVIVLIAVCSSWVTILTNSGTERTYTLFEISDLFSNLRLLFSGLWNFGSFEIALTSLIVSFLAFVMIVLAVVSIVCAVIPEKMTYRFNTVATVINSVIAFLLAGAVVALNFKFRYASFFGLNISSTFLPTKAPFVVIVFSILSRVFLSSHTKEPKALPEPEKTAEQSKGKTCSACGAECDSDAQFCRICGNGFNNEESFCPHCGKSVSPSAVFCNYCGKRLNGSAENDESADNESVDNLQNENIAEDNTKNDTYNEENF